MSVLTYSGQALGGEWPHDPATTWRTLAARRTVAEALPDADGNRAARRAYARMHKTGKESRVKTV